MNSVDWKYHSSDGANIWMWHAGRGLKYRVTQNASNIQAHIIRGEAHEFTSTMGSYATVNEARQRCVDDWQNTEASGAGPLIPELKPKREPGIR